MTIAKNTREAKNAIQNAHDIRCYSLSNGFSGQALAEKPEIWGPTQPGQYPRTIQLSQPDFLAHELCFARAKLTKSNDTDRYTLHIHSNLWYEFWA